MAEQEIFRRRRAAPILDSISGIQATQSSFIEQGRGGIDPPELVAGRMGGELMELRDAIETGDRAEIGGELADMYLLMTRIAHHYQIPLEIAVSDKIARNAEKYSPARMEEMRRDGYSPDEVEAHMKSSWDRGRDKSEFSRLAGVRAELAEIGRQQANGHVNGTPRPASRLLPATRSRKP